MRFSRSFDFGSSNILANEEGEALRYEKGKTMFYTKDEFNTNGQKVIESYAYVVIGHGSEARSVYRNVYENEDMEFYVRYDGFIVTVEENGEVWFSKA